MHRPARGTRRQGDRRRLQHVQRHRAAVPPVALRRPDFGCRPTRSNGRRPGDAQPESRCHRDHRHHSLAGLLPGDQGGGPVRRGRRARHTRPRATRRGRAPRGVPRRGCRARRLFDRCSTPTTVSTRCCSAAPTTRSLRQSSSAPSAATSPSSIPPRRPPARWPACSRSTRSRRRRTRTPNHVQLTTGDVAAFAAIAGMLFDAGPGARRVGRCQSLAAGRVGRRRRNDGASAPTNRAIGLGIAVGAGLAIGAHYVARRAQRSAEQGSGRLGTRRTDCRRPPGERSRSAEPCRAARCRRRLRARHGGVDSAPRATPRPAAAGRGRAPRGRRSRDLGASQRGHLLAADRSPRAAPAQSATAGRGMAAGLARAANRFLTTQQLGLPARLHRHARAGAVRHRAAVGREPAGQAAVRRGEHPRHGRRAGRLARLISGPGSRSTRRPTPSSSRPIRGCARTCAITSSASWRACSIRPATCSRAASAPSSPRVREARDNPLAALLTPEQRAPVRGDAAGHEPARGLQRLGHG